MPIFFWGLIVAMLIVAVGMIVVPMRSDKSLPASSIVLAATLIPLAAVGLYAFLGSPDEASVGHVQTRTTQTAGQDRPLGSVASMLAGLEERLADEPDDADGWILLARSYNHLGENAAALTAYRQAEALGKTDTVLEASLLGDAAPIAIAAQETGASLHGRVALSPDAASLVQPTDTVFIFAKESRHDRMPVVALRKRASELPLDFVLTDKEIMIPGGRLSDYQQLVVTARISRSGNAADDSLGLDVWSDSVSPVADSRIDLLIGGDDE